MYDQTQGFWCCVFLTLWITLMRYMQNYGLSSGQWPCSNLCIICFVVNCATFNSYACTIYIVYFPKVKMMSICLLHHPITIWFTSSIHNIWQGVGYKCRTKWGKNNEGKIVLVTNERRQRALKMHRFFPFWEKGG